MKLASLLYKQQLN